MTHIFPKLVNNCSLLISCKLTYVSIFRAPRHYKRANFSCKGFHSEVLSPQVQLRFLLEVQAQEELEFLGAVVSQEEELL